MVTTIDRLNLKADYDAAYDLISQQFRGLTDARTTKQPFKVSINSIREGVERIYDIQRRLSIPVRKCPDASLPLLVVKLTTLFSAYRSAHGRLPPAKMGMYGTDPVLIELSPVFLALASKVRRSEPKPFYPPGLYNPWDEDGRLPEWSLTPTRIVQLRTILRENGLDIGMLSIDTRPE